MRSNIFSGGYRGQLRTIIEQSEGKIHILDLGSPDTFYKKQYNVDARAPDLPSL
jgi:hypothetical protein